MTPDPSAPDTMETDASSIDRRDALAAAVGLLALSILWMVLRLYWQSALLLVIGLGLGYLGWFRFRSADSHNAAAPSSPSPERDAEGDERTRSKSGKKGGKKSGKKGGKKRKR